MNEHELPYKNAFLHPDASDAVFPQIQPVKNIDFRWHQLDQGGTMGRRNARERKTKKTKYPTIVKTNEEVMEEEKAIQREELDKQIVGLDALQLGGGDSGEEDEESSDEEMQAAKKKKGKKGNAYVGDINRDMAMMDIVDRSKAIKKDKWRQKKRQGSKSNRKQLRFF